MLGMNMSKNLYKETRLAPATMSTIYSSDRATVNCVALVTKQRWEDVVRSLVEQAYYRCNMPIYSTCITDLFFTPIRYAGRMSALLDECNKSFFTKQKYIVRNRYDSFVLVPDNEIGEYLFEGLESEKLPLRVFLVKEFWLYILGSDNRKGIKRSIKERRPQKENANWEKSLCRFSSD